MGRLGGESLELLGTIERDDGLMNNNTCVEVADAVIVHAVGREGARPAEQKATPSLLATSMFDCLKACIPWCGPTHVRGTDSFAAALRGADRAAFKYTFYFLNRATWSHHFAVIKIGGDFMVLQGWVGKNGFRLRDWLGGTGKCNNVYSPRHARFDTDLLDQWLAELQAFESAVIDKDWDEFRARVTSLFCVDVNAENMLPYQFNNYQFNVDWERYALPDADSGQSDSSEIRLLMQ